MGTSLPIPIPIPVSFQKTLLIIPKFERTLDDSSIRRLYIPTSALLSDSLLIILDNISSGLVVYPAVIARRLASELPFMATENIIFALVAKGVSRQEAHEKIRVHSQAASAMVKGEGKDNDLIDRIRGDGFFAPVIAELEALLDPRTFVGRAPEQVVKFTGADGPVEKALAPYKEAITKSGGTGAELHV